MNPATKINDIEDKEEIDKEISPDGDGSESERGSDADSESDAGSDIDSDADSDADSDSDIDLEKEAETAPPPIKKSSIMHPFGLDISDDEFDKDDEDEDEDEDEDYLQKFDENLKSDILEEYYPEMRALNNDEVDILTRIVRDENGMVCDPLHRTLPFITKYERARILGERAKQVNSGAKPFVEVDPEILDGYLIATAEFEQKKIPFIVKRPLPNGGCEYWKLQDLEIL